MCEFALLIRGTPPCVEKCEHSCVQETEPSLESYSQTLRGLARINAAKRVGNEEDEIKERSKSN